MLHPPCHDSISPYTTLTCLPLSLILRVLPRLQANLLLFRAKFSAFSHTLVLSRNSTPAPPPFWGIGVIKDTRAQLLSNKSQLGTVKLVLLLEVLVGYILFGAFKIWKTKHQSKNSREQNCTYFPLIPNYDYHATVRSKNSFSLYSSVFLSLSYGQCSQ